LSYVKSENFKPLKLVINSGNGAAGHIIDAIEDAFSQRNMPIEIIKIHNQPDPTFPNGIPNPLLIENRAATKDAVIAHKADMGIAFDGDFDRCFMFDEAGEFIDGYYIVGLLAEAFLVKNSGAKIVYDPRLIWNSIETIKNAGGIPIQCKSGHSFIKACMRKEDAVYGGELSAHHYFKDFSYCDSGMIPWLLVAELLCVKGKKLSELVGHCIAAYPNSGEINLKLSDAKSAIANIQHHFAEDLSSGLAVLDETDGISYEFDTWRFNLRSSNTEPVVRLNVETRADKVLLAVKTDLILSLLQP
jgi:phosphomannomutase